jgi:hypothetical protein
VLEYKKGKKGLIGLFVGEVKKISKGKADPKIATELLNQFLINPKQHLPNLNVCFISVNTNFH